MIGCLYIKCLFSIWVENDFLMRLGLNLFVCLHSLKHTSVLSGGFCSGWKKISPTDELCQAPPPPLITLD